MVAEPRSPAADEVEGIRAFWWIRELKTKDAVCRKWQPFIQSKSLILSGCAVALPIFASAISEKYIFWR